MHGYKWHLILRNGLDVRARRRQQRRERPPERPGVARRHRVIIDTLHRRYVQHGQDLVLQAVAQDR